MLRGDNILPPSSEKTVFILRSAAIGGREDSFENTIFILRGAAIGGMEDSNLLLVNLLSDRLLPPCVDRTTVQCFSPSLKLLDLHPGVQLRRAGSDAVGEGSEF